MAKLKIKRAVSFVMATVLSLTAFMGVGTNTAFAAAGEKTNVYMVDFPRDGDANYDGVWGYNNLTLKNGWHTGSATHTNLKAIGSFSGNVGYCIEPGVHLSMGQSMTQYDENYFNNIQANGVISGDEIRQYIGRILQYGYRGTISTSWRSQNEAAANSIAHAYATQLLIWETIVGERDANFNHKAASGCSNVKDVVNAAHPLRSKIFSYYDSMVANIQKHTVVPSFCNRSVGSAKTLELEWDGSKYTTTLTDANNVLSNYSFSASISGVSFSTNGNKLTVSMEKAPSDAFTITASKKNSVRRGVVVWSEGKHGTGSSVQDVVSYAQEVGDPVSGYVKMKVSYGSCQIVKTSEDGKVDGINFTISGNGINQTVTTANGGKFQLDNLMPGVYTVTEQSIDKYVPQETHRVTVVAGQVATVNFNNVLKRGDLQVVKSSEDNLVEGVKFHLYGTSLAGIAVDQYAVTDANGVATFKDVLISGSEPYTVEEVDTEVRYVVPENQTAAIQWKSVTKRDFSNILKKFTVTVTKSDKEEGTAQGDATLAGAVYGIYKGETLVDKYVTDANGQFTTKEYICDTDWTVREITPSEGYLLDKTIHKVGADPKLYEVEHNLTANDVTEQVMKGNIAVIKHTDDGETKIETPEKGAEFEVYLKSSGSYDAAEEDERDTLVCDENGFAQSKDMPYGVYTVHQTKGWEGRELMSDFDVFISKDGQTYRYLINNANFESFIKVVKKDAETGKTIPYAGAGFQIYDPAGNKVTMTFTYPTPTTIDTFYTDADGQLVTPEKLEYGKGYSLVEVQAPYGYVLDSTPVSFDVTEENATQEGTIKLVKVEKPNMAQKGTISVEKTGEVFFGVNVSGEEGKDVIYQPVYKVKGLTGATYEITADEDVVTPDGTLRYQKGDVVDTITTDEEGIAKSKELYLGKYTVTETKAPEGMVINKDGHQVELTYAGQEVAVTETATSFYNERQKVKISLEKVLEQDETFGIGKNDELKNISFGLYAKEDIVSESGTVIPADGLIEIIGLAEDGTATVATDLPFGSYYIKEMATDEHYILNDEQYAFTFDYAGQDTETVEIKGMITTIYKKLVTNSVAYMMMARLGINVGEYFEAEDFRDVTNFNTQETLNALGFATSDIAEMGLSEISKTIRALSRNNRIIEADRQSGYNRDENTTERSGKNERDHIHDGRGLQPSGSDLARTAGAGGGQMVTDEENISQGTAQSPVLQSPDERNPDKAFVGSTAEGERTGGNSGAGDGSQGGTDRTDESRRHDELGSADEQHQELGSGDRESTGHLRLEHYDRNHEDKSLPFFHSDKDINEILRTTPHLSASLEEIKDFYERTQDNVERTEFIKSIFNHDYTELTLEDGRTVGYKTFQNVLHLWEGHYESRTKQSYYDWGVIARHFEAMRLLGELNDRMKPLPSMDGQLSLILDGQAGADKTSAFSFSQEMIDAVLTRGSGISNGKMRIYEQFEKSLSVKENVDFLKNEYGWGGSAPVIIGTGINEQHDGKGISLARGFGNDAPKLTLKWTQVEKRIGELIRMDRYLNPKEKEYYPKD